MEQRHREIRERAGREEARLNQEFIEFLKKWGTPILGVAAALSLAYVGMDYLKKQRAAKVDAAFKDLQAVSLGGTLAASPDSLLNVASTYGDVSGVAILATLGAGDSCLQAVRSGLRPGAVLTPDGTPEAAEDLLTDDDRKMYLLRADEAYTTALRQSEGQKGMEIHTLGALYGLAAVEEARGNGAAAKAHLERVKSIAQSAGFTLHVAIAENRIEAIDSDVGTPTLISKSELPQPPVVETPEAPVTPPADGTVPVDGATAPAGEMPTETPASDASTGTPPGGDAPAPAPADPAPSDQPPAEPAPTPEPK